MDPHRRLFSHVGAELVIFYLKAVGKATAESRLKLHSLLELHKGETSEDAALTLVLTSSGPLALIHSCIE